MGKNPELRLLAAVAVAVLVVAAGLVGRAEAKYMVYNTDAKIVPGKLNVHLVPHTHDDVGWLKTVDQYYVGSNNSIQGACVQNVLDSMVQALLADKNRKFIYVEQAFFQRWWRNQSPAMQETVRGLVNEGRLEFINGGWCMHDEAATHYIDMIDQTTLGHRYIKAQFNVTPRIGWQIDPFGHSAIQAYLLGAEVGFDSLFFGRIDYQDRVKRKDEKTLEVIWQGSKSLGSSSQIFAGAFPENYEPPSGFYFEVNDDSPIVQDDMSLFDYNVQDRVNDFVAAAYKQANITRNNHVMWTMGTDFKYQYAHTWFRNMDKLIHYVNQDGRVNALYSTPSIYTDAKYASNHSWPLKTDDYFPYADRINAYWTGYFTSRPALKRYVRELSGYYLAARQLEFYKGRNEAGPTTDSLADALAIAQHHDGVSGTSQQHVADDYAKRLTIGYKESANVVSESLAFLTVPSLKSGRRTSETNFKQCPLLNITYCPPTEAKLSPGNKLVVVIYNSLGWKRDDIVKIPVTSTDVAVQNSAGKVIVSQIIPVVDAAMDLRRFYATANVGKPPAEGPMYWLAFKAEVPPLGFCTYTVTTGSKRPAVVSVKEEAFHGFDENQNNYVEVGPGDLKLVYSRKSGKLNEYIQGNVKGKANTVKFPVDQSYSYYIGDDGSKDPSEQLQASGAYVFRPNNTIPIQAHRKSPLTVFRGPLYDEAHQSISPWVYQITRVYEEKQHAEVEFIVGPIPIDDGLGKEVVTKIGTAIKSKKTFYTDSNGRDYLKRVRDYRSDWELKVNQPVAGNYYPINHGIYMQDDDSEFSVLVDRAVGGSSIIDGEIELMVHRRLLHDDGRGVGEAINETTCIPNNCKGMIVQGKYYFKFDPLGEGAKWRRSFGQELYSPLLLAFTEQDGNSWNNLQVPTFTGIDPSYSLPDNVALITLQELEDGTALLRLAHLYEVGEDKHLSVPARVELTKLFPNKKINKIVEMGLSANQKREDMEKKRLSWKADSSSNATPKPFRGGPVDPIGLTVQLGPMEIRTFIVVFGKKLATTSR